MGKGELVGKGDGVLRGGYKGAWDEGDALLGDDVGEDGEGETGGDSLGGLMCPLCPL